MWAGLAQSVKRLATGWTVRVSNPGGGEIFRTRPDLPWGPHRLLYNEYRVFPGGKAAGLWFLPPIPSTSEVKARVELLLYSLSGPSWSVLGELYLCVCCRSNCLVCDRRSANRTVFCPEYFDFPSVSVVPPLP